MIPTQAEDLLDRLSHVTPSDGDELSLLTREKGWIEAIRHFARHGMLTEAGVGEALALMEASHEWVDTLGNDLTMPPAPDADTPLLLDGNR